LAKSIKEKKEWFLFEALFGVFFKPKIELSGRCLLFISFLQSGSTTIEIPAALNRITLQLSSLSLFFSIAL
jgi:hypothetical protein